MTNAINDLQQLAGLKGNSEMTTPTPDPREIDQSVIDEWAANVNGAVTALKTIIANGNLTAADTSLMNTALGSLDGVAGTTVTPPTPTPTPTPTP